MTIHAPFDLCRARPADAEAIARLQVDVWRESYAPYLPNCALSDLSVEERVFAWRRLLARPAEYGDLKVWLVMAEGGVAGLGASGRQRSARLRALGYPGEIVTLEVRAANQGQGIGSRLLGRLRRDLDQRGLGSIGQWVMRGNLHARRFLERQGAHALPVSGRRATDDVAYGWRAIESPAQILPVPAFLAAEMVNLQSCRTA